LLLIVPRIKACFGGHNQITVLLKQSHRLMSSQTQSLQTVMLTDSNSYSPIHITK